MAATYDGIILGAGHNGMILQAYLGKAGMRVLAIERKSITGGGLATLEDPRHPGFLHNTHAFFQRAITTMPWYADLELERHGAHDIEPDRRTWPYLRAMVVYWNGGRISTAQFGRLSNSIARTPRPYADGSMSLSPSSENISGMEATSFTASAGSAAQIARAKS